VKHFCNTRNAIPNIQDIEIINAFRDGVIDIKTVEEITMKKPKIMSDLLEVIDICIEASEARARLLDARNKGPTKKKQQEDREVNAIDRGNQKQPHADQKERRLFRHPADAEKWCKIHRTIGHDLEECRTYLVCKKYQRSWRHRSHSKENIIGPTLTMMSNLTRSKSSSGAAYPLPPRLKARSERERSTWLCALRQVEE
jgi:hypothetical protein